MLRVLIIDDDDIVIFIQKKMIVNHNISKDPLSFKQARAALDFLQERENGSESFLVLLDINMPEMDGWQFLGELEEHPLKEQIHVVMVTSSIDEKDKKKAAEFSTVKEFVEKPISSQNCEQIKNIPEISRLIS